MGEVSINLVFEQLESEVARTRGEGLETLKKLLLQSKVARSDVLEDEGFHKIFEAIFRLVRIEKPLYLRASKPTTKNNVAARLSSCAGILRLAVEVGNTRLRHKTASAILDHIISTLPVTDEGFCTPLQPDYLKCFHTILSHASHGEHLRANHWQDLVDFVLKAIATHVKSVDSSGEATSRLNQSSESRYGLSLSMRISQTSSSRSRGSDALNFVDDLVSSLALLTGFTNAPLLTRAEEINKSINAFLASASRSQEAAFQAMNECLLKTATENVSLFKRTVKDLLPHISRLWTVKSAGFRDQMLITLVISEYAIMYGGSEGKFSADHLTLSNLLETLTLEYARRNERDFMQIDDVAFRKPEISSPMHLATIEPILSSTRSVSNWALLSAMASLTIGLQNRQQEDRTRQSELSGSRKRRRITDPIQELLSQASIATGLDRLCAIQTLTFIVGRPSEATFGTVELLRQLTDYILDDDQSISSWTLLLLSQLAMSANDMDTDLDALWLQAWTLAARKLSVYNTCRAACHFFDTVLKAKVVMRAMSYRLIEDTFFSNGIHGACTLWDSALSLWVTIMASEMFETPTQVNATSTNILNWLKMHWSFPSSPDRLHNAQIAAHGRVETLYPLLRACTCSNFEPISKFEPHLQSNIYQACFRISQNSSFRGYLTGEHTTLASSEKQSKPELKFPNIDQDSRIRIQQAMVEMLIVKLKVFYENWATLLGERVSNITVEVAQIVTSTCVLVHDYSSFIGPGNTSAKETESLSVQTLGAVFGFLNHQDSADREVFLSKLAPSFVGAWNQATTHGSNLCQTQCVLAVPILELMQQALKGQNAAPQDDQDLMDTEESFVSQPSQTFHVATQSGVFRQDIPFLGDLRSELVAATTLLIIDSACSSPNGQLHVERTATVIDFAIALSADDLLAARIPLTRFFASYPSIRRVDAYRILSKLGESCLQNQDFERCEAALCFCLDVTTSLATLWTLEEEDDLSQVAADIYGWFLEVPLGKGIGSPRVMLGIARMLDHVLQLNSQFGHDAGFSSPRTSLLQILNDGEYCVKYLAADYISHIFDRFILSEHEALFDDIVENLPSAPDQIEGIAIRLYILAELSSKWHTVLRRGVYKIFETAAHVSSSLGFARSCLQKLCLALRMDNTKAVFRLFSSQIFYTWLEAGSLDLIPYPAFGYMTLKELLLDTCEEVVGQVAMRANGSLSTRLSELLGSTWEELLTENFARAEAYSVARDINFPPDSLQTKGSEAIMRKQLGNETHSNLIEREFPRIISILFTSLSEDHGIDRAFTKRQELAMAKSNYEKIYDRSHSDATLPTGQQPSFRAKFLLNEIDFICHRIGRELTTIWEPALVIYVARSILDGAISALGPLHASASLRKMRIVVSLAGPEALAGYPLQMLLHAIREFLDNFHCSEDALGLFWYLIENGKADLQLKVSFLAGLSVSTFASMRGFLGSTQDITTQESQFRSTMSKIQSFHAWLGDFLVSLTPANLSCQDEKAFATLTQCCKSLHGPGTNRKGTNEGDLILHLLEDQVSGRRLLTRAAFLQSMKLICKGFVVVSNSVDDILGEDDDVVHYAPILWSLAEQLDTNDNFRIWTALVLGRAYAIRGRAIQRTMHNTNSEAFGGVDESKTSDGSHNMILASLKAMLLKDDARMAGLAERTLQSILSASSTPKIRKILDPADHDIAEGLKWMRYSCPKVSHDQESYIAPSTSLKLEDGKSPESWACDVAISLCMTSSKDPLLAALPTVLAAAPQLAFETLRAIVHIVLATEISDQSSNRQLLTTAFNEVLKGRSSSSDAHRRLVFDVILYLRSKAMPQETTIAERDLWLGVDYAEAGAAAFACGSYKIALLFLEIQNSHDSLHKKSSSRRSSLERTKDAVELSQSVFEHLEDPDFFFGIPEETKLDSVVKRLAHEVSDHQNLSFQSALYDCNIKLSHDRDAEFSEPDIFGALSAANLHGLAYAVQSQSGLFKSAPIKNSLQTSLNLDGWSISANSRDTAPSDTLLDAFRMLNTAHDASSMLQHLDIGLLDMLQKVTNRGDTSKIESSIMSSLTVLGEIKEVMTSTGIDKLEDTWTKMLTFRDDWMDSENFEAFSTILLGREALSAAIKNREQLQSILKLDLPTSRLLEINTVRNSLHIAREYGAAQFCLNRTLYLSRLAELAKPLGIDVSAAVDYDMANTLYDQNRITVSVRMLREIHVNASIKSGAIEIGQAEVLSNLGQQISEARLEKPDEIISRYLLPAIKELKNQTTGDEAGRVFHNFAAFCDMQLLNTDSLDDFARVEKIRHRKGQEVLELERLIKKSEGKPREQYKHDYAKAKQWFKLDDAEYQRLKGVREKFVQQSLENYLLSMRASDVFGNDVLRFVALWLDQSENEFANTIVGKHLSSVPTRKFAPLMNQLSSRILNQEDDFQKLLYKLLFRICNDHPFHSMHQVFATSRSKVTNSNDEIALSRYTAANKLSQALGKQPGLSTIWVSVHNSSVAFVRLASERLPEKKFKQGSKVPLREATQGSKLEQTINDAKTKIPPPTLKIALRADCDYTKLPNLASFDPMFTIAGGISAPKIITALSSTGTRHKMLLKGGNDDLRQDSIMEQVFEQVSSLLSSSGKAHRTTRQRKLGIRTYKVIPLTPNAGIIEFVQDTIPLHDWLLPSAHQRFYPKDWKASRCRKEISEAQGKPLSHRLAVYQRVCENFHPVMRFFFFEKFLEPDEWFERRLAYSRSSAAVSMLGHVLGLGDRHGHNILLDEKTGEVVHIDLGVAFESGRVLPVPEVVPFRLTRDLVDGMGMTGVEGVFRRCCGFVLEGLRMEKDAIMTVLDVLRYDPLVSWSISPLRIARMQQAKEEAAALAAASTAPSLMTRLGADVEGPSATSTGTTGGQAKKRDINEPSEADRALTVVAKKLGKSLSVEATVNELIQQATDEKNLCVLYSGWAAYA